jgi:alpha-beta hydrolase superfamily lysophospholipase
MMLACEPPPGGLDGFRSGIDGQPENGERVSWWHAHSLPAGLEPTSLDIRSPVPSPLLMGSRRRRRWAGISALLVAVGASGLALAVAYRFALQYRDRVALPRRSPVEASPADFGLEFEAVDIPSGDLTLTGWFVPADRVQDDAHGARRGRGPAVAIVHGWESNRGRTFAHVRYLHAAGFHCLVFDVRGHGDNPEESLPISVPEFGADSAAAARWLLERADVSAVGMLGHSMGGSGAILAGALEQRIGAVVSVSAPADIVRMTRRTFEMAEMRIPGVIATPLAWFTARVLLFPRGDSIAEASATAAAALYRGPLLILHGAEDRAVPVAHLQLIAEAARSTRGPEDAPVETLVLPEFGHRWLYEDPEARRIVASFFARALAGPVAPDVAGERAADCVVERPANPTYGFGALATGPSNRP